MVCDRCGKIEDSMPAVELAGRSSAPSAAASPPSAAPKCASRASARLRPRGRIAAAGNVFGDAFARHTLDARRHELPNRVVLAPLAGIGNWFVRLQAKRYGAGFAVSEMVSSFGLKYGDERTHREFLRIHPEEHPMAVQLFGHDAEVMRIAAGIVAEAGAERDRPQLRLPGAQGLQDRARAPLCSTTQTRAWPSPARRWRAAACP